MKKDIKESATSYGIAETMVLLGCVLLVDWLIRKLEMSDSTPDAAARLGFNQQRDDNAIKHPVLLTSDKETSMPSEESENDDSSNTTSDKNCQIYEDERRMLRKSEPKTVSTATMVVTSGVAFLVEVGAGAGIIFWAEPKLAHIIQQPWRGVLSLSAIILVAFFAWLSCQSVLNSSSKKSSEMNQINIEHLDKRYETKIQMITATIKNDAKKAESLHDLYYSYIDDREHLLATQLYLL